MVCSATLFLNFESLREHPSQDTNILDDMTLRVLRNSSPSIKIHTRHKSANINSSSSLSTTILDHPSHTHHRSRSFYPETKVSFFIKMFAQALIRHYGKEGSDYKCKRNGLR